MPEISAAQLRALKALVAAIRKGVQSRGADAVRATGVSEHAVSLPDGRKVSYPTWNALETAGLVKIQRREHRSESLRRGAYGRWIGGSKTRTELEFSLWLTKAGIAAVVQGPASRNPGPKRIFRRGTVVRVLKGDWYGENLAGKTGRCLSPVYLDTRHDNKEVVFVTLDRVQCDAWFDVEDLLPLSAAEDPYDRPSLRDESVPMPLSGFLLASKKKKKKKKAK